ncbi:MAG TPA: hypothetical protein VGI99_09685, partial [Gemmataceae bacterium]
MMGEVIRIHRIILTAFLADEPRRFPGRLAFQFLEMKIVGHSPTYEAGFVGRAVPDTHLLRLQESLAHPGKARSAGKCLRF